VYAGDIAAGGDTLPPYALTEGGGLAPYDDRSYTGGKYIITRLPFTNSLSISPYGDPSTSVLLQVPHAIETITVSESGLRMYGYEIKAGDGERKHIVVEPSAVRLNADGMLEALSGNFSYLVAHSIEFHQYAEAYNQVLGGNYDTDIDKSPVNYMAYQAVKELIPVKLKSLPDMCVVFALEDVPDHTLLHPSVSPSIIEIAKSKIKANIDAVASANDEISRNTVGPNALVALRRRIYDDRYSPYLISDFKHLYPGDICKYQVDAHLPKIRGFICDNDSDPCVIREMYSTFGVGAVTSDIS